MAHGPIDSVRTYALIFVVSHATGTPVLTTKSEVLSLLLVSMSVIL